MPQDLVVYIVAVPLSMPTGSIEMSSQCPARPCAAENSGGATVLGMAGVVDMGMLSCQLLPGIPAGNIAGWTIRLCFPGVPYKIMVVFQLVSI